MKPAPPAHSNVYWGDMLDKIKAAGGKTNGVIHEFNMRWGCGHTGSAIEISIPMRGCVKGCIACVGEKALPSDG